MKRRPGVFRDKMDMLIQMTWALAASVLVVGLVVAFVRSLMGA